MKRLAKSVCNTFAVMAISPLWLSYSLGKGLIGEQKAFVGVSELLSLAPGLVGQYLRRAFYRLVLPKCGQDACIQFGTVISHATAVIGDRVYVGLFCVLGDVTLKEDVLLGSNVSIINGNRQHGIDRLDVPIREQPGEYPRVTIGCDAWIGDRAIVMADIGPHAVVGAGSVVTRPVPEYAIVVGNPAREIGSRLGGCELASDEAPSTAAASESY